MNNHSLFHLRLSSYLLDILLGAQGLRRQLEEGNQQTAEVAQ